jgi:hypothetical protein
LPPVETIAYMCEPFIADLSATASYSTSAQNNRQSEKVS